MTDEIGIYCFFPSLFTEYETKELRNKYEVQREGSIRYKKTGGKQWTGFPDSVLICKLSTLKTMHCVEISAVCLPGVGFPPCRVDLAIRAVSALLRPGCPQNVPPPAMAACATSSCRHLLRWQGPPLSVFRFELLAESVA